MTIVSVRHGTVSGNTPWTCAPAAGGSAMDLSLKFYPVAESYEMNRKLQHRQSDHPFARYSRKCLNTHTD